MNHFYSRFCIALTTFCFLISLNLKAQETNFTPEHLKAAKELIDTRNEKLKFEHNIEVLIKAQSIKLPEDKRGACEDVFKKFVNKYLTWDLVSDKISELYAKEFTTEELQQLTAFYKTPLGKKFDAKQSEIFFKGEQIGQQLALAHQAELKSTLQAALSKN
jgi:hypothetical protein